MIIKLNGEAGREGYWVGLETSPSGRNLGVG